MAFTSFSFLAFLSCAVAAYYVLPKRAQWGVLLGAGMVFYCAGGGWTLGYVLYTALTVYAAGLALGWCRDQADKLPKEQKKVAARYKSRRQLICLAVCLANFGVLYVLKYWNFTAGLLQPLADRVLHGAQIPLSALLVPMGVSYFMFQSVGYVIDVYRGKYPPERNFCKLLLFVSFFPQMVQGPISRFHELAPQLFAGRELDYTNLKYGIQLAMWGYFKKLVIADRAAVLVSTVMDNPWDYGGAIQGIGVLFYCIQLYGDFSGGIDVTRGMAKLFGIDLAENFRRPLFATSLTDFWRRWHITLGAWMRDYLFYPLSLSKPFARLGKLTRKHIGGKLGKIIPTSLATFIIYFIIGIWHGASWRYIFYGFWNGTLITLGILLPFQRTKERLHIDDKSAWYVLFQIARTNFIIFLGRYFTRAPRLLTAAWMVKETFLHPRLSDLWNGALLSLGLGAADLAVILVGMAVVLGVEFYQERGGHVRAALERTPFLIQWLSILVSLLVLLCFGILRADHISSNFIYMNY